MSNWQNVLNFDADFHRSERDKKRTKERQSGIENARWLAEVDDIGIGIGEFE